MPDVTSKQARSTFNADFAALLVASAYARPRYREFDNFSEARGVCGSHIEREDALTVMQSCRRS